MKKWGIFLIGLIVGVAISCEYSMSVRSTASDETPSSKSTQPMDASVEEPADATALIFSGSKATQQFWRQADRDARRVSVRTANHIHRTLVIWMWRQMPKESGLQLLYGGLIGADPKDRVADISAGLIGTPLSWMVIDDEDNPLFELWFSTKRGPDTVAECRIDEHTFFISVSIAVGSEPRDSPRMCQPLEKLGGKSVQEVLALLEKPPIASDD